MEKLIKLGLTETGKIHIVAGESTYLCGRSIPAYATIEETTEKDVFSHIDVEPLAYCTKCADIAIIVDAEGDEQASTVVITGSASILKDSEVEEIAQAVKGKKI